jgi:hypothetical protein
MDKVFNHFCIGVKKIPGYNNDKNKAKRDAI